jgi:replication factor A1
MLDKKIIKQILSLNPDLNKESVLKMIKEKEVESKGFLTRESAARAVAEELGIKTSDISFKTVVSIRNLVSGLNNVTIIALVIFVNPKKKFFHADGTEGSMRYLRVVDKTGEIKVVLWDEKAEISAEDILGKVLRFSNGYIRQGFYGKIELNIGSKGFFKVENKNTYIDEFPSLTALITKIGKISENDKTVNVFGVIRNIYPISSFKRGNGSKGKLRRLVLMDKSGSITLLLWNKKVDEMLKIDCKKYLLVLGAKVRKSLNSHLELHINSLVDTSILDSTHQIFEALTL